MKATDAENLFSRKVLIIDEALKPPFNSSDSINALFLSLISKGIPVATLSDYPKPEDYDKYLDTSFVIADWDLTPFSYVTSIGRQKNDENNIAHLSELLKNLFCPIFILTNEDETSIRNFLIKEQLLSKDSGRQDRIFVKGKDQIKDSDALYKQIGEWATSFPSSYLVKEWERQVERCAEEMAVDFYDISSNWVATLWTLFDRDNKGKDIPDSIGELLMQNLSSRAQNFSFDKENCGDFSKVAGGESTRKVLQGGRFIPAPGCKNSIPKTGELFRCECDVPVGESTGKRKTAITYYLSISPQCDIQREEDPTILCLKGTPVKYSRVPQKDQLTDHSLVFANGFEMPLSELEGYTHTPSSDMISLFDSQVNKSTIDTAVFKYGEIREIKSEAIIPCVCDEKAISFCLKETYSFKRSELLNNIVGRLLPPYLTHVKQKWALYVAREGMAPAPDDLFAEK